MQTNMSMAFVKAECVFNVEATAIHWGSLRRFIPYLPVFVYSSSLYGNPVPEAAAQCWLASSSSVQMQHATLTINSSPLLALAVEHHEKRNKRLGIASLVAPLYLSSSPRGQHRYLHQLVGLGGCLFGV